MLWIAHPEVIGGCQHRKSGYGARKRSTARRAANEDAGSGPRSVRSIGGLVRHQVRVQMDGLGDHWYTDIFTWNRPAFGELSASPCRASTSMPPNGGTAGRRWKWCQETRSACGDRRRVLRG